MPRQSARQAASTEAHTGVSHYPLACISHPIALVVSKFVNCSPISTANLIFPLESIIIIIIAIIVIVIIFRPKNHFSEWPGRMNRRIALTKHSTNRALEFSFKKSSGRLQTQLHWETSPKGGWILFLTQERIITTKEWESWVAISLKIFHMNPVWLHLYITAACTRFHFFHMSIPLVSLDGTVLFAFFIYKYMTESPVGKSYLLIGDVWRLTGGSANSTGVK